MINYFINEKPNDNRKNNVKKTLSTKEWQFDLIIKMTGLKLI